MDFDGTREIDLTSGVRLQSCEVGPGDVVAVER